MIRIKRTTINFEREPLLTPLGFKGAYLRELWQVAALIEGESGAAAVGLGVQSVLWSDATVFSNQEESTGNSMMFLATAQALRIARGAAFNTPTELLEEMLPITYKYAREVTGNPDLHLSFALNALVPVDNAAWLLYFRNNGLTSFDEIVPEWSRGALSHRHEHLSAVPLVSYRTSVEDIVKAVESGHPFLKIKIGSDPGGDGDQEKMLEWDKARLAAIHKALEDRDTPHTESGNVQYYLDANGRYSRRDYLLRFLEHAERIGALERISLLEEPFPEEHKSPVHDIPVRLAVDESVHSDEDALERIELGYGAIALKPIAKTMTMSFKIAAVAHEKGVPCFCADLTVNPVMIDWNKNVASRLALLPGMKVGVLETNGHQNYKYWETMKSYHPCAGASWTQVNEGLFHLNQDFYAKNGGIFEPSVHYTSLVEGEAGETGAWARP